MDFAGPYLGEQLIAYIGNKRALLPFLHGVFSGFPLDPLRSTFLDPFAGSGAVSRLARAMGFHVRANDWEPYSSVINTCHLRLSPSHLDTIFGPRGGIDAVLGELNGLPPLPDEAGYISRHYAPRRTDEADWKTERLFYTRENALVIDAIRQRIEEMYPGVPSAEDALRKAALLAPLLYQAATHTNTSGVFKAFHHGFGGHGRDALKRIMGPIRLIRPVLSESPSSAEVTCMDAAAFLRGRAADVCYLDPPYAVHQYGSNYFMLNTIALWDKPPVNQDRAADGRLRHKAGIRADWTRTRSAFCYRDTAAAALKTVVDSADCRWLVVSYGNEGLIGLAELCDLVGTSGELAVLSRGYAKYPGGKQSLYRTTRNMELVLVVRRGSPPRTASTTREALMDVRLARLLALSYNPSRIRTAFPVNGDAIVVGPNPGEMLRMQHFWKFTAAPPLPRFASARETEAFAAALAPCAVLDVREEIDVLVRIAEGVDDGRERARILREILRLLNKLAHRKYRGVFMDMLVRLRAAEVRFADSPFFGAGLDSIEEKARKRTRAADERRAPSTP